MKAQIQFNNPEKTHIIKIKKCSPWWWLLLLLLLPLLLLITCNKTVRFKVVDEKTIAVNNAPLSFEYSFRKFFDFKTLKFNTYQNIANSKNSANDGMVEFKNVKYTTYQWLFFFNETSKVFSYDNCRSSGVLKPIFRKLGSVPFIVTLNSKGIDNGILVKDLISKEPLPNAKIEVSWDGLSTPLMATTDATGTAFLKQAIPLCKSVKIKGSCKGYIDSTYLFKEGLNINKANQSVEIFLRPEQTSLLIFAKDSKSNSPLPLVKISIKDKNGKLIDERMTNSGGKSGLLPGSAEFKSLPSSMDVVICGNKEFYKEKCISGNVKELRNSPELKRTLFLDPGEGAITFWIVDLKDNSPIAGASVALSTENKSLNAISADDGSVTFSGLNINSTISIIASRETYKTNNYTIQNKKYNELIENDKTKRTIPLEKIKEPDPIPPTPPTPPAPPQDDGLKGKSGDLRVNLQWKTIDDLDLFVTDPCGNTIWALELTHSCQGSTGVLDIDANTNRYPRSTWTNRPQENIYFENPAKGKYSIQVEYCSNQSNHIGSIPFNITVVDKGVRRDYSGSVGYKKKIFVTSFNID